MMTTLLTFMRRERLYILIAVFAAIVGCVSLLPDGKGGRKEMGKASASGFESGYLADRERVEKLFSERKDLAAVFGYTSLGILFIFFLGLIVNAMLVLNRMGGGSLNLATYAVGKVEWGAWDTAKVVILFFFFGDILVIAEAFLSKSYNIFSNDHFRMVLNSFLLDAITVVLILYFTVGVHRSKLAKLGISLKNFWKNVFIGIMGYIALVPALMLILAVTAVIMNIFKYVPEKQVVVDIFFKEENKTFLFLMGIFAGVVGPMIEELFFRGFAYSALRKRVGVFAAAFMTAGAFAALHAYAVGFLPIFAIGLMLTCLYEKTGTLVAPIAAHIAHNTAMVGMVFLLKQLKA